MTVPTDPARAGQAIPNEIEQAIADFRDAAELHGELGARETEARSDAACAALIAAIAAALTEARGMPIVDDAAQIRGAEALLDFFEGPDAAEGAN